MVAPIVSYMTDALEEAKKAPPSREMSLVITKLEEALLWYSKVQ